MKSTPRLILVPGDGTRLQMSLLACLLGYGEVGIWLVKQDWVDTSSSSKNTYLRWIKEYEGQEYRTAVKRGLGESSRGC
jgi:hydroxymethylpyrimidine/phosphomethylpyrimidine kinase